MPIVVMYDNTVRKQIVCVMLHDQEGLDCERDVIKLHRLYLVLMHEEQYIADKL